MQRFRGLDRRDKEKMNTILLQAPWMKDYLSSELVFENLYVWTVTEPFQMGEFDHFCLLRCVLNGQLNYLPPIAETEDHFREGLEWIRSHDPNAKVIGLTSDMVRLSQGPETLILYDDFYSEYIYRPNDLIQMYGKIYKRKRNQLKQFQQYDSHLRAYTSGDLDQVLDLLDRYIRQGGSDSDHPALLRALTLLDSLDLFCDLYWVKNKVVALSIGCVSAFGHGIVLFEKADVDYAGSYTAIIQKAAEIHYRDCAYISRQEDIGIPELRKAKLAYHPIKKERKFVAQFDSVIKDLYLLYRVSFDDSADYVDYFFLRQVKREKTVFVMEGEQVVSGLHLVDKTLSFNQQNWTCPFVVAAATLPDFRRQGRMRAVMKETLNRLAREQRAFLSLYPVEKQLYTVYGFVPFVFSKPLPEGLPEMKCTLEQTVSAEALAEIYDHAVQNCEGQMVRSIDYWHDHINRLAQDGIDFYLLKNGRESLGYLAKKAEAIEEILVDKPVQVKVKELPDLENRIFDNDGKPENMIRICSLMQFLRHYHPPVDTFPALKVGVKDDWIDENNATFSLSVVNGKMKVEPCEVTDVCLTIAELTTMVFTGKGPKVLQALFPERICISFDRY